VGCKARYGLFRKHEIELGQRMDQIEPEQMDEDLMSETPEDVAVLYSWAKMQGAKYRDFSPSRREYRAQMRFRAAEAQRESERRAQFEAETTAAANEKAAGELVRRAAAERLEAARRAEAVAAAEAAARREEREIAEAHASVQRRAQEYAESEMRRREAAGPQPTPVAGQISDSHTMDASPTRPGRIHQQPLAPDDDMQPARYRQSSRERVAAPSSDTSMEYLGVDLVEREAEMAAAGLVPSLATQGGPIRPYEPKPAEERMSPLPTSKANFEAQAQAEGLADREERESYAARVAASPFATRVSSGALRVPQGYRPDESSEPRPAYEPPVERREEPRIEPRHELPTTARIESWAEENVPEHIAPAWIYSQTPQPPSKPAPPPVVPVETLPHSHEQVAPRWFALKSAFDHSQETQPQRAPEMRAPLLTLFSLAGGVGKTSIVATLGRALSATGERLLPFYFGASEQRLGAVRTFLPPAGGQDAPISLVSYDLQQRIGDAAAQEWIGEELSKNGKTMQRVLVDLTASAAWAAGLLARMNSIMLVPVTPDMNSVISLQGVDKFFAGMLDGGGQAVQPFYLLNRFDESLSLHLDVREVLRQKLGDRLLPFAIRRWEGVSEALAEGMTVIDYAPESAVAVDYMNLLEWLRTQSVAAAAPAGFRNARWSER
jgi:cellulose biosynthesis protein BcsQ